MAGPVFVSTDEEVRALAGVAIVRGDLEITGESALTSLAALEDLRCVQGALRITDATSLTSLSGLEGLVAIGGELEILRDTSLIEIEALSSLRFLGPFEERSSADLTIVGDPALRSLAGLEGLSEVRGDLGVRANAALLDLDGLRGIETVEGNLGVTDNDALPTLAGLEAVVMVTGWLRIQENLALTEASLPSLEVVDDELEGVGIRGVEINNNAALTRVSLPRLTRAVTIEIHDNRGLLDVDLGALRELHAHTFAEGDLLISGDALESVSLGALERVDGDMFVWGEELGELIVPRLTMVGGGLRVGSDVIRTTRHETVARLDLSSLVSVEDDLVLDFTAIEDVDGLRSLTRVGRRLAIEENSFLRNLRGLSALTDVDFSLTVRANPVLPTCEAEALEAQLEAAGWFGSASIAANDDAGVCP